MVYIVGKQHTKESLIFTLVEELQQYILNTKNICYKQIKDQNKTDSSSKITVLITLH